MASPTHSHHLSQATITVAQLLWLIQRWDISLITKAHSRKRLLSMIYRNSKNRVWLKSCRCHSSLLISSQDKIITGAHSVHLKGATNLYDDFWTMKILLNSNPGLSFRRRLILTGQHAYGCTFCSPKRSIQLCENFWTQIRVWVSEDWLKAQILTGQRAYGCTFCSPKRR